MDVVHAIGMLLFVCCSILDLILSPENVSKGSNDRPSIDVIIVDCGEVRPLLYSGFMF